MMLATNSLRRLSSRARSGSSILSPLSAAAGGTGSSSHPRWFSSAPTDPPEEEEILPIVEATEISPPPPTEEPAIDELEMNMKPLEIVSALDRHIVGQPDAKRAVAIAMRNRWRRRQLPEELRKEVTPRNVLLVGPTGKLICSHGESVLNFLVLTIFGAITCTYCRLRKDRSRTTHGHAE